MKHRFTRSLNMHAITLGTVLVLIGFALPLNAAENVLNFSGTGYAKTDHKFTGLSSVTLEAWIRATTPPNSGSFGCIAGNGYLGSVTGFGLYISSDGSAVFQARKGGTIVSPSAEYPFGNDWHHVTGVSDAVAQETILYLDGEEVARVSSTVDFSDVKNPFGIGARNTGSWGFNFTGNIAEVRLWDHARSPEHIKSQMGWQLDGTEPGLIGYWPLNEGSGAAVYDLSSNDHDGTLVNTTWIDANGPPLIASEIGANTLVIDGVPERYGNPEPPYGETNNLTVGSSFLCSTEIGTVPVATGTRARCESYAVYTNGTIVVASGMTNAFTYTHDAGARLEWQWELEHEITFTAGTGGTVNTNGGWYNEGSNVTATVTVTDPLRHFSYWTGDVPVGMETDLPLSFPADQPRAISAYFGGTFHVTTNGSDTADGLSWETAKRTIQPALDLARSGDRVLVSNGTYTVDGQIAVTNGITLRSVNGADEAIIERSAGTERLVLLKHADAVVDGFTITKGAFGGAYIDGAGTLINCIISNNTTPNNNDNGAGVYLNQGGVVKGCRIINNRVSSSGGGGRSGGGVYMIGGGLVDSCVITNNASDYGSGATGGGVSMTGAACTLRNSLIADNFAQVNGAGVYNISGTIENCTIANNDTPSVTGVAGLYNNSGKIINTIIAYNNNANGLSNHQNAGTTTYSYTCTTPSMPGIGNTVLDPQFVDLTAQDYRLRAGPCVDTGINQDWMVNAFDVAGNPRIVSETVDMGAYEHVPGPLRIGFEGIPTEGFASNRVVFTAYASGTNTAGLLYSWSFKNDTTINVQGPGQSVVTNLYLPGLYAVRLTVVNAIGETDTLVREQYIKVAPEIAYVSTNGASIYPYDSWANAATNIQDALDAGMDGTLVLVNDGIYGITKRIEMPRNITLRSINGAEKTEIRRTGGTSGIFYLTVPEAVVDGFTIANALDTAVYLNNGGVVSNCIIRDNHVPGSGGYGGGVHMASAGKLENCQIINNSRHSSGGAGAVGCGIYMTGAAVVESCIITNNSTGAGVGSGGAGGGVYMTGGMLRNSLIAGNKHNITVGGIYASGGTIESCTIVSNSVPATGIGGLYNSGRTIRNSIIQFNTSTNMISNYGNTGAATYYNCNTYPTNGLTGSANIEDNPLFKDVARGDYRLKNDSPCINAGAYQDWMEGAFDLAGEPRIQNRTVDIGAYEGHLPPGSMIIVR